MTSKFFPSFLPNFFRSDENIPKKLAIPMTQSEIVNYYQREVNNFYFAFKYTGQQIYRHTENSNYTVKDICIRLTTR